MRGGCSIGTWADNPAPRRQPPGSRGGCDGRRRHGGHKIVVAAGGLGAHADDVGDVARPPYGQGRRRRRDFRKLDKLDFTDVRQAAKGLLMKPGLTKKGWELASTNGPGRSRRQPGWSQDSNQKSLPPLHGQ